MMPRRCPVLRPRLPRHLRPQLRQPALDLGGELGLRRPHPGVANGFVLGGVGPQLGAVHRDMAQPDQARAPTQGEDLH